MAPFDALLSPARLPVRIFILRLLASVGSTLILYFAVVRLCGALDLRALFTTPALFCVFLTQTLWASIAHVGNDALAIPLTVLFLGSLVRIAKLQQRKPGEFVFLSGVLAAGLVTKAYFIAFVPVFGALFASKRIRRTLTIPTAATSVALPILIAGPWYARNLMLYRSLSGSQESVSGVGFAQAISAIPKINWVSSALSFSRWSLWTGDWSFISFSKPTLSIELLLIAVGLAIYLRRCRGIAANEHWLGAACLCFLLGLIYQTCVTFVSSNGASKFPEPWYAQGVVVCIWVLAFKGFQSGGRPGRLLAGLSCALSAWVGLMTYVSKLPLFYGTGSSRSTMHNILAFWGSTPGKLLAPTILGPLWVFYSALLLFVSLVVTIGIVAVRDLIKQEPRSVS